MKQRLLILRARFTIQLALMTLLSCLFVLPAFAQDRGKKATADDISELLSEGKGYISTRYRLESVDQDGIMEDALASTLQTRLGFETARFYSVYGLLEFEDVSEIGNDNFNSTINGRTQYPVVADVEGTRLNQAFLETNIIPDTAVLGGRHALKLDNLRFVGDVGWRQNNQTHDGATIKNTSIEDLQLLFAYSWQVDRIFGEDSPVGKFHGDAYMLNAQYKLLEELNLTAYGYMFDFGNSLPSSSRTYGGRLNGSVPATDDLSIVYDGAFATQSDWGDNPVSYDATYYRVEGGAKCHSMYLRGMYEVLGSDDGLAAFQTPLATLHKWNGWADKFLTTPDTGLRDLNIALIYKAEDVHEYIDGATAMAKYHFFDADEGSGTYGEELDLDLVVPFMDHFKVGVRYAQYFADDFGTDTKKLIFTLYGKLSQ